MNKDQVIAFAKKSLIKEKIKKNELQKFYKFSNKNETVDLMIEDIYKKHNVWVDIVCAFGCNKSTAEDLVSEMYIKIYRKLVEGLVIEYGEKDYNYYYIFKTLKSLFYDLKRKEKNIKIIDISEIKIIQY